MFEGRNLVIATMHKKESVIAPILEKDLGVNCYVPEKFDTDKLGTFTGEIPRKLTQIETARQKCILAMEQEDCDLGVASEGSFGPHPTLFFVPCDEEIIVFIDKKHKIEVIAKKISTETNFDGKRIDSVDELRAFAQSVKFPSHGIILKSVEEESLTIYKNHTDLSELEASYHLLKKNDTVLAETDMRAMNNPSRMSIISLVTSELVKKIKSTCPNCDFPGFSVTEAKSGLPCETCKMPTRSTLLHLSSCQGCGFTEEKLHPNGKQFEEAMYCDFCNP